MPNSKPKAVAPKVEQPKQEKALDPEKKRRKRRS
ncbi:translation initiation factor IF-2 [Actinobacillus equuli]|nr:translation initiation factor IF-2 [Actinobacillus equuli]